MIYPTDPATEYLTSEGCYIIEILNGPEQPEVSLAQARVAPGQTTRWHTLEAREVYYLLKGEGYVELGEDFGRAVGPGDAVNIPAGVRQRIGNTGQTDLIFLCVCAPRFRVEGYADVE